jgi:hypothetical protein
VNAETKPFDRAELMRRTWATRRAADELANRWAEQPICLCGCGGRLEKRKGAAQSKYRVGHDSKLKAQALAVIQGKADPNTIPPIAKALRNKLGFLKTRPELMPAFK